MAGGARQLPKWQAQQILCQTLCQYGTANTMPNLSYNIVRIKSLIFFSCVDDTTLYNQGNEREKDAQHDCD